MLPLEPLNCSKYTVLAVPAYRSQSTRKRVRLGELLNEGTVSASEQCNAVDPFSAPEWTVEQCAPTSLVPRSTSPHDLLLGRVNVLLAIVDQPRVPFLKQVEQVLLQLHASMQFGMLPAVFMGSTAFVPSACAPRRSPLTACHQGPTRGCHSHRESHRLVQWSRREGARS